MTMVMPYATLPLYPAMIPGTPAIAMPAPLISGHFTCIIIQMEGMQRGRCVSFARIDLPDLVSFPETTQLLDAAAAGTIV